jgi:hypothetical protein
VGKYHPFFGPSNQTLKYKTQYPFLLFFLFVVYRGFEFELYIKVVGQDTEQVQKYDDKDYTNRLLAKSGLTLPASFLVSETKEEENVGEKIIALERLDVKTLENFGKQFLK